MCWLMMLGNVILKMLFYIHIISERLMDQIIIRILEDLLEIFNL